MRNLARVPALTSVHLQLGALFERKPDTERAFAAYRQLLALIARLPRRWLLAVGGWRLAVSGC